MTVLATAPMFVAVAYGTAARGFGKIRPSGC